MLGYLEQNVQYRRDVMRVLLLITCIGGLIFSAINFYRGLLPLATLEVIYDFFRLFYGVEFYTLHIFNAGWWFI